MSTTATPPSDAQVFFSHLVTTLGSYEYIFAAADLLINSLHVFILSRKYMRISSMNSILIGIAIADMVFPIIAIKKQLRIWICGIGECVAPQGLLENNLDWALYTWRDNFRRSSTWLGLMLTIVRTVVVKKSSNQSFHFVFNSRFGWALVFFTEGISMIFSIFYYIRFQIVESGTFWRPPISCTQYPSGYSQQIYIYQERDFYKASNGLVRSIYLMAVGVFAKWLPCVLFPTLTIILIKELRKENIARESAKREQLIKRRKEMTTKLVIYMTALFLVIEFPIGVCFWIKGISNEAENRNIPSIVIEVLNMVYVVMSISHFFICFSMSSQYRTTVKNMISKHFSNTQKSTSLISVIHAKKLVRSSHV